MALCQLVHGWSADWPIPLAGTWLPQIATGPCVLGPGTKALNCHNRFGVSCLKVHLRKETTLSLGTSLNYHQTIARLGYQVVRLRLPVDLAWTAEEDTCNWESEVHRNIHDVKGNLDQIHWSTTGLECRSAGIKWSSHVPPYQVVLDRFTFSWSLYNSLQLYTGQWQWTAWWVMGADTIAEACTLVPGLSCDSGGSTHDASGFIAVDCTNCNRTMLRA